MKRYMLVIVAVVLLAVAAFAAPAGACPHVDITGCGGTTSVTYPGK